MFCLGQYDWNNTYGLFISLWEFSYCKIKVEHLILDFLEQWERNQWQEKDQERLCYKDLSQFPILFQSRNGNIYSEISTNSTISLCNYSCNKGAFTYDVRYFLGIFDLQTYPNQMVYYISLFSKIRCSLTYLPTQKSDVRDVSAGATGATAVAPKFSYTYLGNIHIWRQIFR